MDRDYDCSTGTVPPVRRVPGRRRDRGTPRRPGSAAAPPCRGSTGPAQVDVRLRVALAGLELLGQPVEHHESLRTSARDRHEPTVAHERPQYLGDVGRRAGVQPVGRLGGAGILGGGPGRRRERLTEQVEGPVRRPLDQAGIDQPPERLPGPRRVELGLVGHGVERGRAEHEGGDDAPSLLLGEQSDEVPGRQERGRVHAVNTRVRGRPAPAAPDRGRSASRCS